MPGNAEFPKSLGRDRQIPRPPLHAGLPSEQHRHMKRGSWKLGHSRHPVPRERPNVLTAWSPGERVMPLHVRAQLGVGQPEIVEIEHA